MLGTSDHVFDAHSTFNMASLEHVPFVLRLCIISRLVYASTQVYKSCIQLRAAPMTYLLMVNH